MKRYKNILHTHWVKGHFSSFGSNSIIEINADIQNANCIHLGSDVYIRTGAVLTAWIQYLSVKYAPTIHIGNRCSIGTNVNISAIDRIEIQDDVLIGRWVTIIDHSHGTFTLPDNLINPVERPLVSKGGIVIEEKVWISDKVTICGHVRIGKGAVIGANSVVTKDVPPYTMVAGCPAKIIKTIDVENL